MKNITFQIQAPSRSLRSCFTKSLRYYENVWRFLARTSSVTFKPRRRTRSYRGHMSRLPRNSSCCCCCSSSLSSSASSSSSSSFRFHGGLHLRALQYRHLLDCSPALFLQLVFRSHILFIKPVLIKELQIFFLPCLISPFCSISLYLVLPTYLLILPSQFSSVLHTFSNLKEHVLWFLMVT